MNNHHINNVHICDILSKIETLLEAALLAFGEDEKGDRLSLELIIYTQEYANKKKNEHQTIDAIGGNHE